jgi:hypothetical protein
MQVITDVMTKDIKYPQEIGDEAQSLLAGLLTRKVEDRLGTEGADEVCALRSSARLPTVHIFCSSSALSHSLYLLCTSSAVAVHSLTLFTYCAHLVRDIHPAAHLHILALRSTLVFSPLPSHQPRPPFSPRMRLARYQTTLSSIR